MNNVMEEIAGYQREFEALVALWNAQSLGDRTASWAQYTDMVDHGDEAYHPFAIILNAAWCNGWDMRELIVLESDELATA